MDGIDLTIQPKRPDLLTGTATVEIVLTKGEHVLAVCLGRWVRFEVHDDEGKSYMTTTPSETAVKPIADNLSDDLREAHAERPVIDAAVAEAISHGLRDIYLVGCGGSLLAGEPGAYLLQSRLVEHNVHSMNAAEFACMRPARLGPQSLVVAASFTGTTKETVSAAQYAADAGANTLAVAEKADSPLAEACDRIVTAQTPDGKQVLFASLAWAILRQLGLDTDFDAVDTALTVWPDVLPQTLDQLEPVAHAIATSYADAPVIYVLASGANYGAAQNLSMCYLQEMQWIHSGAHEAGEFLHGAMEIVTDETPVILFVGEDASRPVSERAKQFLDRFDNQAHIVDARTFQLDGVPDRARPYVTPLVFHALTSRIAAHFAAVRGHPLDTRRYMFKVDY